MPKWLKDAVFYEIYPQSFKDSDGDGIGDFKGIVEKLDYIKELGCNAIWLNPCFDSPFKDAGYDVRDYKKTAARYGSNEDLIHLFDEVHKRDMHILLDLVPGHTSEEHEWFKESAEPRRNEYSDRYIWTDDWFHAPQGLNYVAGESARNGVYILNFFKSQPALNYGFLNPAESWQKGINDEACIATREALKDIMCFWLDAGCDGFRVDMADSLVKKDDEKKSGTSAVWKDIRKMLDDSYPEAALVSEWNMPQYAILAGFHMDFCLDWAGSGYNLLLRNLENGKNNSFFCKNSNRSILDFFDEYMEKYEKIKNLGSYSLITGNHDTTRVSYFLDETELKLAYAFLLTMPGNPFIYYGDEIGLRYLELESKEGGYTRTGSRTPMQWDDSINHGFSEAEADKLYLPVDGSEDAPTVERQKKDENSLLNTVKALLAIRREYDDLKDNANLELIYALRDKRAFAYRRGNILMLCNPSDKEEVVDICERLSKPYKIIYGINDIYYRNNEYVLGAQSFGILLDKSRNGRFL